MFKLFLLKYTPTFLLNWAKLLVKFKRERGIAQQKTDNTGVTKEKLIADFRKIGLDTGDSVLVHSSLSKIGYVEGGAATVIAALTDVVGEKGTILFPAFPAKGKNKDHLENTPVFDIATTPSLMGSITEYFRQQTNVYRSFHPTDSICARGELGAFYTTDHFGQLTPYTENSPFRKLCLKNGKILMLGTTLNACTNLHTLEDAVEFLYPVYDEKIYTIKMINFDRTVSYMKTKVHNPEYSVKRNCDALKPLFERENVLINGKVGAASSMLIDANKMHEVMIRYYYEKGITMYTPSGIK